MLDRSGRPYRPATVRSYRQASGYLEPALGRYGSQRSRAATCSASSTRCDADGSAGSTIRNKLDPLRVLYRRAIQDEQVTRSPIDQLAAPGIRTKPRASSRPNAPRELLALLPDSERALWTTLFYAGLRIGELRALRWTRRRLRQRRHPRAGGLG